MYEMNKILLYILFFLFSPRVFSQSADSWQRSYAGTIGSYPVTIHLHKMGHTAAGYYYYASTERPIYFYGNDTTAGNGKLILYGYGPEDILTLSVNATNCTGIWKKAGDSVKTLPVKATEKKMVTIPGYDLYFIKGHVDLRPGMPESPFGMFEAASVWPRGNTASVSLVKKILNRQFNEASGNTDIQKTLLAQKDQYLKTYLDERKNVADSELVEYAYTFNEESTQWAIVAYQSLTILTLANWNYLYLGGAHGSYTTLYIVIDLLNNKELTLKNVLTNAGINKLGPLLEKYYRRENGLGLKDDLTENGLFENQIKPNENFFVTSKGIGFNYAPYEIGPYAMGEVNIFIPFTELTAYLQPGFKKLLLK
jgi:hypothetical protein